MKKIFIILLSALLLTGCTEYKRYNPDEVVELFSDVSVYDLGSVFNDITEISNSIYIDKSDYLIYFYTLNTSSDAVELYNYYKDDYQSKKDIINIEKEIILGEYQKYTLETGNQYMVVVRCHDTIIIIDTDVNNKEEVQEDLAKFGY